MGWYKIQGTEDVVGDDAYNVLRIAARDVALTYRREFGRPPTKSEWEHLMRNSLEPIEELETPGQESLCAEPGRPRSVTILLEEKPDAS
jgi:hypothetical protein